MNTADTPSNEVQVDSSDISWENLELRDDDGLRAAGNVQASARFHCV